jgi:chlorobactene glucosyltransferase
VDHLTLALRGVLLLDLLGWLLIWATVVRKRTAGRWRLTPESPGPLPDDLQGDLAPGVPRGQSVAVIVPARNEVENIGPCVRSLLAMVHSDLQVIVLDDGSTDGTADVLADLAGREPRLTVLRSADSDLPSGWLGKPWACQRAAAWVLGEVGETAADARLGGTPSTTTPDWLLFVDADVRVHPRALSAVLGHARRHGLGLLSGFGTLVMGSFWEKVLQPAIAGLIIAGNDLDRTNDPARRGNRPLANGQFLLFRRDAYLEVGGHRAVANNVIDDVGLAMAVTGKGYGYNLLFLRTLFSCRMYDSLGAVWNGWSKNLYAGLGSRPLNLFLLIGLLCTGTLLPYGVLAAGLLGAGAEWLLWGVVVVAVIQRTRLTLDRAFEQDTRFGLTHAPATVMLIVLLLHSAVRSVRGTATWKGRTLPAGGAA